MKKILLAAIIMSVGAFAADGTVSSVMLKSNGVVKMTLKRTSDSEMLERVINGTAEANKAMLATILTAKSTGATLDAYSDGITWTKIYLK